MARNPLISIRLPEELLSRVDAIVSAVPGLSRPAVLRVALERGLAELETDPRYSAAGGKRRK